MDKFIDYLSKDVLLLTATGYVDLLIDFIKDYYPNTILFKDIGYEKLLDELGSKKIHRNNTINSLLNTSKQTIVIDLCSIVNDTRKFQTFTYHIILGERIQEMCRNESCHVIVINMTCEQGSGSGDVDVPFGGHSLLYSFPLVLSIYDDIRVVKDRDGSVGVIDNSKSLIRNLKLDKIM
jgi:hypothetical protein